MTTRKRTHAEILLNLSENVSVYALRDEDGREDLGLRVTLPDGSVMYEDVFPSMLRRLPKTNAFDHLAEVAQAIAADKYFDLKETT